MSRSQSDVSELLEQWRAGRAEALDQIFPLVYDELRRLAASRLRGERESHTLQTTALVHEAYLRLVGKPRAQVRDRSHFFAIAAQAMRRVLLDSARRRHAGKRDGGAAFPLGAGDAVTVPDRDLIALDDALAALASVDPRQAKVVELRYFGGLTAAEAATALEVSEATVQREWRAAKLWLRREMAGSPGGGSRGRP
jgi:RNA polymerase sigma factor (TIGR02999 family)